MEIDRTSDELRVESVPEDGSMSSVGNGETSSISETVDSIPDGVEKLTVDSKDEEEAPTAGNVDGDEEKR